jgi:hypothetical protein
MRDQQAGKLLKIAAVVVFTGILVRWSNAGAAQNQGQSPEPLNILGYQTTLQEKLGRDDGVSFVIHFAGDIHGNLDACG